MRIVIPLNDIKINETFKKDVFELRLMNKPLLYWYISSLKEFNNEHFIFVSHEKNINIKNIVKEVCYELNINDYKIIYGNEHTELESNECDTIFFNPQVIIKDVIKFQKLKSNSMFVSNLNDQAKPYLQVNEKSKEIETIGSKRITNFQCMNIAYILKGSKISFKNFNSEKKVSELNDIIKSEKLKYKEFECEFYSLNSVKDLEKVDRNFIQNSGDKEAYKKYLLSNMYFKELEEYYEKLIKEDDKYILQFLIYLFETGNFKRAFKLFEQYDIQNIVAAKYNDNLTKIVTNLILGHLVIEDGKVVGFKKLYHHLQKVMDMWFTGEQKHIEYYKDNRKEILNDKKTMNWISGVVITFIIREQCEKITIDNYDLVILAYSIKTFERFTPIPRKYLLSILIDYGLKYNREFFTILDNTSHHIHRFMFELFGVDVQVFKPGIKRYLDKLYLMHNVKNPISDLFMEKGIYLNDTGKNKKPKIAFCLTGASRRDVKAYMKAHKERIVNSLSKEADVDTYIFTWDNHEVYPGLGSRGLEDEKWILRYFGDLEDEVPESITYFQDFQKFLPRTCEKLSKVITKENKKENFLDAIPSAEVVFNDEKAFNKKYGIHPELLRDEKTIQAKMYYGIYGSIMMAINSGKKYDYVIRNRIDYPFNVDYTLDDLKRIQTDELGIVSNYVWGVMDSVFVGQANTMYKMAQLWNLIDKTKNLSPLLHNNNTVVKDAEPLLYDWITYNKIKPHAHSGINVDIFAVSHDQSIPDFTKDLEADLRDIKDKKMKKEYEIFFEKIKKYIKKF